MAGQSANSNQWNQGHSSFGNASYGSGGGVFWGSDKNQFEQSYAGHLARQATAFQKSFIGAFIAGSLKQVVNANESFTSTLKIFSASEDTAAFNYLISNSDDGYGNFIEMAALVTENSTFVFSDSRNTSVNSYIDFNFYKGRGTTSDNKTFFDGQRILAQVHTHNEHSEISSPDFATSAFFKVPVYAIDIATQMVGRGNDFRSIENANGRKYDSTTNVSSVNSLLNNNFNIRNDAKNLLLRFGL